VTALPSTPLPVPGVGQARWQLELIRCRAGESADFVVEACNAEGFLAATVELREPANETHRDVARARS
jgi:protein ImuA